MTGRPSGRAADLPLVQREPVVLPPLPAPQELAWHVLLDLDQRDLPWALVGGQMTLLHCLENAIAGARVTDDGDVVLDVWTQRQAVAVTGAWLETAHGFTAVATSDGFGYRYERGATVIDLLVPEGLRRQARQPLATRARPALAIEGGNQAVLRVERVPVRLGPRAGHVRRPTLLGALVIKAAAFLADARDPGRHAEDIALLTQAALDSGSLRTLDNHSRPHDRQRLRNALARLPAEHPCWRSRPEPLAAHEALGRLAQDRDR